ncbi:hypothetical protein TREMEDRAFT_28128 [Tremella mesenterica DSM 1558]|uniref:uncharacterized protein n=1 Tax=Tremella mesenterica (strain ATCC 24925 / CBS 8224 / DSM 1558 / NBRC 9311 / NRRL Y-6157 / RJB 2259-6 / UBC 559-6) TaxID=578456 RepID=UPI0003F49DCB|nr:uncharacterized protein TREMEDRAFT_28128 [Tremella mesenterica DSM 1558]EIW71327.1 hypothetical protein TREMEDRAFT_28128 [Tremella mesenterica DSM 1558]
MGIGSLFIPSLPKELSPVHPPLGIHPNYAVNKPTTLVLREKIFSFTGDDFAIKDIHGQPVIKCKGKFLSLRDRKIISDLNGNVLFQIRDKAWTIHTIYIGEDPQGEEIFRVRKRFSFGTMMETTFLDSTTNTQITLTMQGDMWGGSADIMLGPTVIAQINRSLFNMRQIFGDQQTYYVSVAPGVDLTLIAAMCICFDETKNDRRRR